MIEWVRRFFPSQAKDFVDDESPRFPIARTTRDGSIDTYSDTWIFVQNWAESELIKARDANDSTKRTEIETAALRGRIKLLKELLDLPNPKERKRPTQRPNEDF